MKKLSLIFPVALFLIFPATTNINKQPEDHDCILNDSALFYYNQFVSNFGGMQEDDMDSVIIFYTKAIQSLDDTINSYKCSNQEENSYQIEVDLSQEYKEKCKQAKITQELYKFHKQS